MWQQIQLLGSQLLENEHHNHTTKQTRLTTERCKTCSGSFQQTIRQRCTDLSHICVSSSSQWLSTQQDWSKLLNHPWSWTAKTSLAGQHCRDTKCTQQEEERCAPLMVSKNVCPVPTLAGLKGDDFFLLPKQLHKNGSSIDRRPAASSRCRICLLT